MSIGIVKAAMVGKGIKPSHTEVHGSNHRLVEKALGLSSLAQGTG